MAEEYAAYDYRIPSVDVAQLPDRVPFAVGPWFYEELESRGVGDGGSHWIFRIGTQPPEVERYMQERRAEVIPLLNDRNFMRRLTWEDSKIIRRAFLFDHHIIAERDNSIMRQRIKEALDERTADLQGSLLTKISTVADDIEALESRMKRDTLDLDTVKCLAQKKRSGGVAKLTETKKALARAIACAQLFDNSMDPEQLFKGLRAAIQAQEKLLEATYSRTLDRLSKDYVHAGD